MRILLIVPTYLYKFAYPSFMALTDFPTGFAFLASSLKNAGHEVIGLNLNNITGYSSARAMITDRISRSLQECQPDLIGTGGICTDYAFLKDATQIIRKFSKVPLVLGGGIVTHDPDWIYKHLKPDYAVAGEGEEAIIGIANGYYPKGIVKVPEENYRPLDARPFPDYEPFSVRSMLDKYSLAARYLYRYTRPNPRPMVLVSARACPFGCTFCVHRGGAKYRIRSIPNIMAEIKSTYERYDFNILVILDELFAVNNARMTEFCKALIEARSKYGWDFDWAFQTHASAHLDKETLELAKRAGCYLFGYGIESASPRVLKSMNKKIDVSQIQEAIQIADSVKIGFGGNFIFGDPAETYATISETMAFFSQYCADIHSYLGIISPYPGSKLFDDCVKSGRIRDKERYYDSIDNVIWNMTTMPDRLWMPWTYLLSIFSTNYSWVKQTRATRCVPESSSKISQIWANCPHCGKEVYCRETIGQTAQLSFVSQVLAKANNLLRNRHSRRKLFFHMKVMASYLLNSRNPYFKTLEPIRNNPTDPSQFIITGCPHCNKRLKINLKPAVT